MKFKQLRILRSTYAWYKIEKEFKQLQMGRNGNPATLGGTMEPVVKGQETGLTCTERNLKTEVKIRGHVPNAVSNLL